MENKENTPQTSTGKIWLYLLMDAFLLISFVLLNDMRSTSKTLHEGLGVAIGVSILIHLVLHWKMIVGYFKKIFKKPAFMPILRLVVNLALLVSLFAIIITGLMMANNILPSLGIRLGRADFAVKMYHEQITRVTIYILGLHLLLQWKWYLTVIKRLIIHPLANLFGKKQLKETA